MPTPPPDPRYSCRKGEGPYQRVVPFAPVLRVRQRSSNRSIGPQQGAEPGGISLISAFFVVTGAHCSPIARIS